MVDVIELPKLYLARHGDTAWTDSHQHTGRTDLPLNECGEAARAPVGRAAARVLLRPRLHQPLAAAAKTCELAGFGPVAEVDSDLIEWDYGRFEGTRTSDVLRDRPGWELFRDGCPGGECPKTLPPGPTVSSPGSRA